MGWFEDRKKQAMIDAGITENVAGNSGSDFLSKRKKEVEDYNKHLDTQYDTEFGTLSGYAIEAMKNNTIDSYNPKDDQEKAAISKLKDSQAISNALKSIKQPYKPISKEEINDFINKKNKTIKPPRNGMSKEEMMSDPILANFHAFNYGFIKPMVGVQKLLSGDMYKKKQTLLPDTFEESLDEDEAIAEKNFPKSTGISKLAGNLTSMAIMTLPTSGLSATAIIPAATLKAMPTLGRIALISIFNMGKSGLEWAGIGAANEAGAGGTPSQIGQAALSSGLQGMVAGGLGALGGKAGQTLTKIPALKNSVIPQIAIPTLRAIGGASGATLALSGYDKATNQPLPQAKEFWETAAMFGFMEGLHGTLSAVKAVGEAKINVNKAKNEVVDIAIRYSDALQNPNKAEKIQKYDEISNSINELKQSLNKNSFPGQGKRVNETLSKIDEIHSALGELKNEIEIQKTMIALPPVKEPLALKPYGDIVAKPKQKYIPRSADLSISNPRLAQTEAKINNATKTLQDFYGTNDVFGAIHDVVEGRHPTIKENNITPKQLNEMGINEYIKQKHGVDLQVLVNEYDAAKNINPVSKLTDPSLKYKQASGLGSDKFYQMQEYYKNNPLAIDKNFKNPKVEIGTETSVAPVDVTAGKGKFDKPFTVTPAERDNIQNVTVSNGRFNLTKFKLRLIEHGISEAELNNILGTFSKFKQEIKDANININAVVNIADKFNKAVANEIQGKFSRVKVRIDGNIYNITMEHLIDPKATVAEKFVNAYSKMWVDLWKESNSMSYNNVVKYLRNNNMDSSNSHISQLLTEYFQQKNINGETTEILTKSMLGKMAAEFDGWMSNLVKNIDEIRNKIWEGAGQRSQGINDAATTSKIEAQATKGTSGILSQVNEIIRNKYNISNDIGDLYRPATVKEMNTLHAKATAQIADALGIKIEFITPKGEIDVANGMYHNGKLYISTKGANETHIIFGHELAEAIKAESPELYKEFIDIFINEFNTVKAQDYIERLQSADKDANALHEAANDFAGELFNNPNFIKKVVESAPNVAEKIIRVIKETVAKLKSIINPNYQVRQYLNNAKKVERAYLEAVKKFLNKKRSAGSHDSIGLSVRREEMVVKLKHDIFNNVPISERPGKLYNYLKDNLAGKEIVTLTPNPNTGAIEDWNNIQIVRIPRVGEKVNKNLILRKLPYPGRQLSDTKYRNRANASIMADGLLEKSELSNYGTDTNNKHGDFAKYGWEYRKAYFINGDGKTYQALLNVALGDENILYDITNIKIAENLKEAAPLTSNTNESALNKDAQPLNIRLSQNDKDVNNNIYDTKQKNTKNIDENKKINMSVKRDVSQFKTNTIDQSTLLSDEVKSKLNDKDFVFQKETNAQQKNEALKNVQSNIEDVINRLSDPNKETLDGGVETAEGALVTKVLANVAQRTGDYNQLASWLKNIASKTRENARALQATRAAYAKDSTEAVLIDAQRTVDKVEKIAEEHNPALIGRINKQTEEITSEIRKAKKSSASQVEKEFANDIKKLNSNIKEGMKTLGQKLSEIAVSNKNDKSDSLKQLQDYLIDTAGVSGKDAEILASKIQGRFDELVKEKSQSILNQKYAAKNTNKQVKNLLEKVTEAINLGAYGNAVIRDIIKDYNKLPTLKPEDINFIIENVERAKQMPDGSYEQKALMSKVYKVISDKTPATFIDKLRAWQRIFLILHPKSIVSRNPLGNTLLNATLDITDNLLGAPIDYLTSKIRGSERTTLFDPIGKQKAGWEGFKKGTVEWYKDIKNRVDTNPTGAQLEISNNRVFNNNILNAIDEFERKLLQAGDRPFYEAAVAKRLYELMKIRKVNVQTPELIAEAILTGLERTFQNDSALSKMVSGMKNLSKLGINGAPKTAYELMMNLVIPFSKTPANILDKAIDLSPGGIVKAIGHSVSKAGKGTFDQKYFVDKMSRGILGSAALLFVGYKLASNGHLISSLDKNKGVAGLQQATGQAPYSIKWGNNYYTIDWADPTVTPLLVGAEIYEQTKKSKDPVEALMKGILTAGDAYFKKGVLQNVSQLASGYSPSAGIAKALINTTSQIAPTAGKQIAQVIDPYVRETYDPNTLKSNVNKIISKIPGASMTLPEKVDVMGDFVKSYQGKEGAARLFDIFLNPGFLTEDVSTSLQKELIRVGKATGEDTAPNLAPKEVTVTIKGKTKTYELSSEELVNYQTTLGKITKERLEKLVNQSTYKKATDEEKAKQIKSEVLKASSEAKEIYLKRKK